MTACKTGGISAQAALWARNRIRLLMSTSSLSPAPLAPLPGEPADALDRPTSLLSFTRMLEGAAAHSGIPHLGLDMAALDAVEEGSLLRDLLRHAPTVGHAIEGLVRFFPTLQTGTTVRLLRQDGAARFVYGIQDPSACDSLQDATYTLGKLHCGLRRAAGNDWSLGQVTLAFQAPGDIQRYGAFFGAPVQFAQSQTALHFASAVLAHPIPTASVQRYHEVCMQMRRQALVTADAQLLEDALCTWIRHAMRRGDPVTLEAAAADFGLTERTLQRRLGTAPTGFLELRAAVRMEQARSLLADSHLSVTQIAQQLGFSETSAFTRAFRHHTRQSPRAYRRHGIPS